MGANKFIMIVGPMFSGKSSELFRLIERAQYAQKRILVIKPKKDTRVEDVISARIRNRIQKISAISVSSKKDLQKILDDDFPDVLVIDEVQFFGQWLIPYVRELLLQKREIKIIAAGLQLDAALRPFGIVPKLLCFATKIKICKAVCVKCGKPATLTQKNTPLKTQIQPGEKEYEARCFHCYTYPPLFKK